MSTTTHALETRKSRELMLWPGVLLGLTAILYAPILKNLVGDWWNNPDYGHGFLVPVFSGYILWREREKWLNTEIKPNNFGLLVMIGAVVILLGGSLGAELFTTRISLLILLAGMILFLAGWKMLRAVSFPLAFLILMIPLPALIYNQITFPLQLLASRFATFWLELGALAVVLRFVDEGRSPFGRVRFHVMEASSVMERFPMSSKLNNYPPLLEYLFNLGRQTGDAWIAQNGDALGQRSTMDLQQLLPGSIWNNI